LRFKCPRLMDADSDAATWSPQGRLHQVEYAIEAIKVNLATVLFHTNPRSKEVQQLVLSVIRTLS
jgi:hypothetical protein